MNHFTSSPATLSRNFYPRIRGVVFGAALLALVACGPTNEERESSAGAGAEESTVAGKPLASLYPDSPGPAVASDPKTQAKPDTTERPSSTIPLQDLTGKQDASKGASSSPESKSLRPLTGFAARAPRSAEAYFGFFNLGTLREAVAKSAFWSSLSQFLATATLPPFARRFSAETMPTLRSLVSDEIGIIIGSGAEASLRRLVEIGYLNDIANIKALIREPEQDSTLNDFPILGESAALLPLLDGLRIPSITLLFRVTDAPGLLASLPPLAISSEGRGITHTIFKGANALPFKSYKTTLEKLIRPPLRQSLEQTLGEDAAPFLSHLSQITLDLSFGALDLSTIAIHLGPDKAGIEQVLEAPLEASLANSERLASIEPFLNPQITTLVWAQGSLLDASQGHHPVSAFLEAVMAVFKASENLEEVNSRLCTELEELVARGDTAHRHPKTTDHVGIGWTDEAFHYEGIGGFLHSEHDGKNSAPFTLPEGEDTILSLAWTGNPEDRAFDWRYFEDLTSTLATGVRAFLTEGATRAESEQGPLGMILGMSALLEPVITDLYGGLHALYHEALGSETLLTIDLAGEEPAATRGTETKAPATLPFPRITVAHSIKKRARVGEAWGQIEAPLKNLLRSVPTPGAPLSLPQPEKGQAGGVTTYAFTLPAFAGANRPAAALTDATLALTSSAAPPASLFDARSHTPDTSAAGIRSNGYLHLLPISRAAISWIRRAGQRQMERGSAAAAPIDPETLDAALQLARLTAGIGEIRWQIYHPESETQPRFSLRWDYQDILHTN